MLCEFPKDFIWGCATADYSYLMFKELGDSIPIWITLNEPAVFTYLGYIMGIHAPGKKDIFSGIRATYIALLAHGLSVEAFRATEKGGRIGITLNLTPQYPASDREENVISAKRMDLLWNRWFLDPIFKGNFPKELVNFYHSKGIPFEVSLDEMKKISQQIDFLGVNYYTRKLLPMILTNQSLMLEV